MATTSTKSGSGTKKSELSLTHPKQSQGGDDLVGSLASPSSTSPDHDDNMIGPPLPPKDLNSGEEDGDEDVEADDYDPVVNIDEYQVPLSNEIVLRGHTKVVSALAIDPTDHNVHHVEDCFLQLGDLFMDSSQKEEVAKGSIFNSSSAEANLCVTPPNVVCSSTRKSDCLDHAMFVSKDTRISKIYARVDVKDIFPSLCRQQVCYLFRFCN